MTTTETFIGILIHLIIPLVGLAYFISLTMKMKREKIVNAPNFELFIVFATYGALLLITLTTLIWKWSGMASLGVLYLILGAPLAMGVIAYKTRKVKDNSKYHNLTYQAGVYYFAIAPLNLLLLLALSKT